MKLKDARPPSPLSQRLLTASEAATYLGISERTLWTLSNCGEIKSVRFGKGKRKSVRLDVRDLDDWIEKNKKGRR